MMRMNEDGGGHGDAAYLKRRAPSPKGTERCPVMSAMAVINIWSSTNLRRFHVLK